MKFSYIVIAIVVVVLGFGGYLLLRSSKLANPNLGGEQAAGPQRPTIVTPLDPETIPNGEKIVLGTARGSVAVNNFYKIAQGYDGAALVIRNTPEYQIIYAGEDSAFGIYITGASFESQRLIAESDFLATLGISQEQACSLNVSEGGVSLGANFLLSFCI